jgi:hypothetical protein
MQEIFDSQFILKQEVKIRDFALKMQIEALLLEAFSDAKFFYRIEPKEEVHLSFQDLGNLEEACKGADAIFAPLVLHKTNNIDDVLSRLKNCLNKNGILLGNFFGLGNLQELGELFAKEDFKRCGMPIPRMLPLMEIKTVGAILQKAGFKNIVVASEEIEFEFANLKEALIFLKHSGESNCLKMRDKTLLSGNILKKYLDTYKNSIKLKFDVCFFSCLNI